jgi:general secretion pathway protein I
MDTSFPRKWESGGFGVMLSGSRPRLQSRVCVRAAGFSLLEVLAAFVILALVGTALFRLFSGALGNASLADEYSRATLYAESRLAVLGVETPLREGTLQGNSDDGYYAWTATVALYTPPGTTPDMDNAAAAMAVRLWRLVVTVRWPGATPGSERNIVLASSRVAIKDLNP